jgi:hypothetical protein
MLARTIASYTEKNMNSKISVQYAMPVSTNETTTVRKIPTIIRGKDRRGRTPLLQIKTVKGLKREKFLPLWCGTYLSLIAWSVYAPMLGKLNFCFDMSNERGMERSDILLMIGSENISTIAMRRTFLMIQGILDLVLAPMEGILSERWGTRTVLGVDVSFAAPQAHGIVNVAFHREYSPGIVFIFSQREEGSLSCLRLTQGVTPMSTTRLYRGYVNWS